MNFWRCWSGVFPRRRPPRLIGVSSREAYRGSMSLLRNTMYDYLTQYPRLVRSEIEHAVEDHQIDPHVWHC